MKRKNRRPVMCAYCRNIFPQNKTTEDHVPPRGVFGKKRPPNLRLIKVTQCLSCQRGTSKSDEVLKALIGLGPKREGPDEELRREVSRAMDLRPFWLKELAASLVEDGLDSSENWPGNEDMYILPMGETLSKLAYDSLRRVCIGLVFSQTEDWDHRGLRCHIVQVFDDDHEAANSAIAAFGVLRFEIKVGSQIFDARWDVIGGLRSLLMHLHFYRGMGFLVFFFPEEMLDSEQGRFDIRASISCLESAGKPIFNSCPELF